MTAGRVGAALAVLLLAVGCGGSSSGGPAAPPTQPSAIASSGASSATAVTSVSLAAALSRRHRAPRPTYAFCKAATAAQIAKGPFGRSSAPQFSCRLTIGGRVARYDVQVQRNGCYVAERHRPGQAIYGCGARFRD